MGERGIGSLLQKVGQGVAALDNKLDTLLDGAGNSVEAILGVGSGATPGSPSMHIHNRFGSFAPQTTGRAKWYVDGCSYFWALSEAIEEATDSIYIMDWWLSPEIYLRRPPAQNQQYRLDNMLRAAAERGVQVRIIVYKEVEQALTLNSDHTKQYLESLHPNIRLFRHPDHKPSGQSIISGVQTGIQSIAHGPLNIARMSKTALKTLFGASDDVVLFWAHHEKLCVVDNRVAFMGGLDACFGRWDTNSHPIADVHPSNPDAVIFPGQDYNNARVYDFAEVDKWEQNKLDRNKYPRMGWSDIALSLSGPILNSLVAHFVDRWNYIFGQKYNTEEGKKKYAKIPTDGLVKRAEDRTTRMLGDVTRKFEQHGISLHGLLGHQQGQGATQQSPSATVGAVQFGQAEADLRIQLCRSCGHWSSGHHTESSIQAAYIDAITNAQRFVYIENQFFITATGGFQMPVQNRIGAAIVDRVLRAHREGQPFRVIVCMPAVPAFAGDLHSDGALGTRAIMEFQYHSISRGGHSIIELLAQAGVPDPDKYVSFYNLRNYDRINTAGGNAWDTVAPAYMNAGTVGLNNIPPIPGDEMDSFVSEELYIHSKLLIADDRLVICGSANLNDRSQLGDRDSEIAVVIEDPNTVPSSMAGLPWTASRFAASLRRQIFRKHLGLLPDQPWDRPTGNFTPVTRGPNEYDWGSPHDWAVADPMGPAFDGLWRSTARTNTEVFDKVFHVVPSDRVRSWSDYDAWFSRVFVVPGSDEDKPERGMPAGKVPYGHVVRSEFPGGAGEVRQWLARVRGTLVNMPLGFLADVKDIAKEGLALNEFTDDLYT